MKKTFKNTLNEISDMTKSMPRTVNEAINFEGGDVYEADDEPTAEEDAPIDDMEADIPGTNPEAVAPDARAKAAQLIDSIRKQALRAMADLAEDPEDENYLMLKKVWQMTDRKPEKEGEKNI